MLRSGDPPLTDPAARCIVAWATVILGLQPLELVSYMLVAYQLSGRRTRGPARFNLSRSAPMPDEWRPGSRARQIILWYRYHIRRRLSPGSRAKTEGCLS